MLKRTFLVMFLAASLVLGVSGLRSAQTGVLSDEEVAAISQSDGLPEVGEKQGRGNGFLRVLKAPFKAIGRLFGRGKKDDNKLHRLSQGDVKRFESAKVTRVVDAVQTPAQSTPPSAEMGAEERIEQGRNLLNSDKLNEAIAELSLATSMDPKLAEAHNLLGVAYHRKGLRELARKSFEAALKLNKKDPQILNNLGYLFYDQGDYKNALAPLKKAANLAPNDARILNNLALTQSQLGKFDDAYKNFAKAGGEIEGRLNMANRLEIAGLHEKAREHYEAARAQAQAKQKNSDSQAITVVMEIENGRVKYASIPNRRPDLAAYEATALRIARGRRFAATKTGQESIVIRIHATPAS